MAPPARCWRPPYGLRLAFVALPLLFTFIGVQVGLAMHSVIMAILIPVLVAAAGTAAVVRYWRVRLELASDAVIVQNLLRSHRLSLTDIAGVSAGSYGIWITTRDGRRICSSAVQKYQLDIMAGTETWQDRVAQTIADAAGAQQGGPVGGPRVSGPLLPLRAAVVMTCTGVACNVASFALAAVRSSRAAGLSQLLLYAGLALMVVGGVSWWSQSKQRRTKR
jgi:Bacterial PH domain